MQDSLPVFMTFNNFLGRPFQRQKFEDVGQSPQEAKEKCGGNRVLRPVDSTSSSQAGCAAAPVHW